MMNESLVVVPDARPASARRERDLDDPADELFALHVALPVVHHVLVDEAPRDRRLRFAAGVLALAAVVRARARSLDRSKGSRSS